MKFLSRLFKKNDDIASEPSDDKKIKAIEAKFSKIPNLKSHCNPIEGMKKGRVYAYSTKYNLHMEREDFEKMKIYLDSDMYRITSEYYHMDSFEIEVNRAKYDKKYPIKNIDGVFRLYDSFNESDNDSKKKFILDYYETLNAMFRVLFEVGVKNESFNYEKLDRLASELITEIQQSKEEIAISYERILDDEIKFVKMQKEKTFNRNNKIM